MLSLPTNHYKMGTEAGQVDNERRGEEIVRRDYL